MRRKKFEDSGYEIVWASSRFTTRNPSKASFTFTQVSRPFYSPHQRARVTLASVKLVPRILAIIQL